MNIRKVLAGSLAAITAGATLVMAGFGVGVADYVSTSDGTLTSPIYVIGDDAKSPDTLGLTDIATAFAGYATKTVAVGVGAVTAVSDGYLIDSDLNKTYKDEAFNKVLSTLTSTELPTLLSSYEFTDKNNTKITYQQQMTLGTHAAVYGTTGDIVEPTLYTAFDTNKHYNLTVYFLGGLDPTAVDTDYSLTLFGKEYNFGTVHTNSSLELFSATGAQTVTLSGYGDEETVSIAGETFTLKLTGWTTTGTLKAYITINDQTTSPAGLAANTYYTLPGTTTRIYIKSVDVVYTAAQEAQGLVTIFVGADKLALTSGQQVTKNDVAMTNTYTYFNTGGSSTKINSLTFQVTPNDDTYLVDGGEFVDPLFGSFKYKLSDLTPAMTAATRDKVTVEQDGINKIKLTFTNKAGTEYSFNPAYWDGSAWQAKKDATYDVHAREWNTSSWTTGNITKGDYFLLTSGDNSYVYSYSSYYYVGTGDTKNYVELKDIKTGTAQKIYVNVDSNLRIGADSFAVSFSETDKSIIVDQNGDSTTTDRAWVDLKTKTGGLINLRQAGNVTFTEVPLYNLTGSNNPTGVSTQIVAASSTGGMTLTSPALKQIGTTYNYRDLTSYGTYWYATGDASGRRKMEIYYPGTRPAYVNVAVGTDPVFTAAGVTEVEQAVKITSPVAKLASEVDTATLTADVVLVGGPCANSLVATLAEAGHLDTCADWGYTTGIIKEVADAFVTGKKALIVAGTTAADTRSLAAKVMTGTLSFEA